jgi:hypothetical protein
MFQINYSAIPVLYTMAQRRHSSYLVIICNITHNSSFVGNTTLYHSRRNKCKKVIDSVLETTDDVMIF